MTVAMWAESRRMLSSMSALPGRFSLAITPWLREPLECLSDRRVQEVVMQKSAQIGWTDGVINNYLGYTIDIDPAPTIVMFPREKAGRDFNSEKFEPMVEATRELAEKIVLRKRDPTNRVDTKQFPGGFIKYVGSNSPSGVKSTSAKRLIIEEPDDCNVNLKGQGDAIALLKERGKTFGDKKIVVGGTPTIAGLSAIVEEMQLSDKREWRVPCHECGEAAPLVWDNVKWSQGAAHHPIFGTADTASARYACPHCGVLWTDAQRVRNARRGQWVACAPFRGVAGFAINELVSGFADSSLPRLVEKYLRAVHEANAGNIGELINFWNSTLGLPWAYKQDVPSEDALEQRGEVYEEFTVPAGGLLVTAGVDVQHDRLAVVIIAWGRGQESWRVWWGELYGNPTDKNDAVWAGLDEMLFERTFRHASGAQLGVSAVSIDAGDGNTADVVYDYARKSRRKQRNVMAIKGSSTASAEIFRKPAGPIDVTSGHKAAKYGLKVYIVGTSRAKDLILGGEGSGWLQLTGTGPGRMHWYRGIRADWYTQVTSEVKAPARGLPRGAKVWQKKAGVRNEALDCEVYALHAARALRIDIRSEAQWAAIEQMLLQPSLLSEAPASDEAEAEELAVVASAVPVPAARGRMPQRPARGGFVGRWKT
jgi:phage terminase large subunit GpA-like protein